MNKLATNKKPNRTITQYKLQRNPNYITRMGAKREWLDSRPVSWDGSTFDLDVARAKKTQTPVQIDAMREYLKNMIQRPTSTGTDLMEALVNLSPGSRYIGGSE